MRKIAICFNPYRYQSQLLANFIKGLREFGGSSFVEALQTPFTNDQENVATVSAG